MVITASAMMAMIYGVPGFYKPRMLSPWQQSPGQAGATSHYDTSDLKEHLNSLIDWDILNQNSHRLSVGAVNVRTGNYKYFDTALERIGPEHIMASGALPPAFPAVKIGAEFYWDGGIVSNTPLQYLLELNKLHQTLVFQVDLFNARGDMPKTVPEVRARLKDIMYSSRTRNATNRYKKIHDLQTHLRDALSRVDPSKWTLEDKRILEYLIKNSRQHLTRGYLEWLYETLLEYGSVPMADYVQLLIDNNYTETVSEFLQNYRD